MMVCIADVNRRGGKVQHTFLSGKGMGGEGRGGEAREGVVNF